MLAAYEAPRSPARAGRGIKAELRRSLYPPSLYQASAWFTLPFIPAAHAAQAPALRELQCIRAKANKKQLRSIVTGVYSGMIEAEIIFKKFDKDDMNSIR